MSDIMSYNQFRQLYKLPDSDSAKAGYEKFKSASAPKVTIPGTGSQGKPVVIEPSKPVGREAVKPDVEPIVPKAETKPITIPGTGSQGKPVQVQTEMVEPKPRPLQSILQEVYDKNAPDMPRYKKYLEINALQNTPQEYENWKKIIANTPIEEEKTPDEKVIAETPKAIELPKISEGITQSEEMPAINQLNGEVPVPSEPKGEAKGDKVGMQKLNPESNTKGVRSDKGTDSSKYDLSNIDISKPAPPAVSADVTIAAAQNAGLTKPDAPTEIDWEKIGEIAKGTGIGIIGVLQSAIQGYATGLAGGQYKHSESMLGQLDAQKQMEAQQDSQRQMLGEEREYQKQLAGEERASREKIASDEKSWQMQLRVLDQQFASEQARLERAYQERIKLAQTREEKQAAELQYTRDLEKLKIMGQQDLTRLREQSKLAPSTQTQNVLGLGGL